MTAGLCEWLWGWPQAPPLRLTHHRLFANFSFSKSPGTDSQPLLWSGGQNHGARTQGWLHAFGSRSSSKEEGELREKGFSFPRLTQNPSFQVAFADP